MPAGGHGKKMVCLRGEIWASLADAKRALGISYEKLDKMIMEENSRFEAHGFPIWFPKPLDPEHRKRLDGWARTLPGTKFTPWRSEAAKAREAAQSRGAYAKAAK